MPQKGARVLGPYPNGVNFRLVVVADGRRKSVTAPTLEQAQVLKASLAGELQQRRPCPGAEALADYTAQRTRDRGLLAATAAELRRLTQGFLPADAPLSAITPAEAARLYADLSERRTARGTQLS